MLAFLITEVYAQAAQPPKTELAELDTVIGLAFKYLGILLIALAMIFSIYYGIQYFGSGGNESKAAEALAGWKKIILGIVVAFVMLGLTMTLGRTFGFIE